MHVCYMFMWKSQTQCFNIRSFSFLFITFTCRGHHILTHAGNIVSQKSLFIFSLLSLQVCQEGLWTFLANSCVVPLSSLHSSFLSAVHDDSLSVDHPQCPVCSVSPWGWTLWILSSLPHGITLFGWLCCLSLKRGGRDLGSRRQLGSRYWPAVSSQKMSLSVGLLTILPALFGSTIRGTNKMIVGLE